MVSWLDEAMRQILTQYGIVVNVRDKEFERIAAMPCNKPKRKPKGGKKGGKKK